VRSVELAGGAPFALGAEIPLAHSGAPRVPLSGDLAPFEDGEWLFRSVAFFGGTAAQPNPVTCQTCHVDGASANFVAVRQPQPFYELGGTSPYLWTGSQPDLHTLTLNAFLAHGTITDTIPPGFEDLLIGFFTNLHAPPSPWLAPDGSLPPEAEAGRQLFEGTAGCTACHAAPLFVPAPPAPLTIDAGIGTGLAPINVPTLRGTWTSAPYLHDGSRASLVDVLAGDPADAHGVATAGLTAPELEQLAAYVRTL
jgi:hypothetical protein